MHNDAALKSYKKAQKEGVTYEIVSQGIDMADVRSWIVNELRVSGYKVNRKNFGKIVFDEKD